MSWTSLVIEKSLIHVLLGRSAIQPFAYFTFICLYPFFRWLKSPLLKKRFSDLNLYEAVKSSGLVVFC